MLYVTRLSAQCATISIILETVPEVHVTDTLWHFLLEQLSREGTGCDSTLIRVSSLHVLLSL